MNSILFYNRTRLGLDEISFQDITSISIKEQLMYAQYMFNKIHRQKEWWITWSIVVSSSLHTWGCCSFAESFTTRHCLKGKIQNISFTIFIWFSFLSVTDDYFSVPHTSYHGQHSSIVLWLSPPVSMQLSFNSSDQFLHVSLFPSYTKILFSSTSQHTVSILLHHHTHIYSLVLKIHIFHQLFLFCGGYE